MCGSRLHAGAPTPGGPPGERPPRLLRVAGLRDRALFALAFIQTWSGARRQLAVIDAELRRLHGERGQLLLVLGEAAYREDENAATQTREAIRVLDEQIGQELEEQRRVVEKASGQIDHERGFVASTQVVDRAAAEEPEPGPKQNS